MRRRGAPVSLLVLAALLLVGWTSDRSPPPLPTSPELRDATDPCARYVPNQVIVRLAPGRAAEPARLAARLGLQVVARSAAPATAGDHPLEDVYLLELPPGSDVPAICALLEELDEVEYAEPNRILEYDFLPDDPLLGQQWGLVNQGQFGGIPGVDIGARWAWEWTGGAEHVVVAVVDSGIDAEHPDLAPRLWRNPFEIPQNGIDDDGNGFVDDEVGWNFEGEDADPLDAYGHGTHVAGIIAAQTHNGQGIAGVSPRALLMAVRVGDVTGLEAFATARGIVYAVDNGARIINASWGCYCEQQVVADAVRYALTSGVLFVAAAGNDGTSNPHYPAYQEGALAVAATDGRDRRAEFNPPYSSNFGDWIDLCAPGARIMSCLPRNTYALKGGTSMATPMVSGIAALVYALDPGITLVEMRRRLISTAVPVDLQNPEFAFLLGSGRASAIRALTAEPGPHLILRGLRVEDEGGDGHLAAGERFQLVPLVRNTWRACAGGSVRAATDDPYLTLDGEALTLPPLAGEETAWLEPGFGGRLAGDCPPNRAITVELAIDYSGGGGQGLELLLLGNDERPDQQGWPVTLSGAVTASPLVVDIDGDGRLEVFVGTRDGKLHGLDARGKPLPGWPVELGVPILATAAAADMDGDGRPEICLGDDRAGLHLLRADGSQLPGWPIATAGHGAPSSVAFGRPADGDPVQVVDADWAGMVRVLQLDASPAPGWPRRLGQGVNSSPAIADLDGDGESEILIAGKDGLLHVWHWDGAPLEGWPVTADGAFISAPAAGDLDGDGDPEVVCATVTGRLHAWHHDGQPLFGWPATLEGGTTSSPALADLNGDGLREIVIGTETGQLTVLDYRGQPLPGWPIRPAERIDAAPVIGDLDGNGELDILIPEGQQLHAFNPRGRELPGWPLDLATPCRSAAVICDLDGDGDTEVLIAASNGRIVAKDLQVPYTAEGAPWPAYARDPARSGAYPNERRAPLLELVALLPTAQGWLVGALAADPEGRLDRVELTTTDGALLPLQQISRRFFAAPLSPLTTSILRARAWARAVTSDGRRSAPWPFPPTTAPPGAGRPPPPPWTSVPPDHPLILGGGYRTSTIGPHGGSLTLAVLVLPPSDADIASVELHLAGQPAGIALLDDGRHGDFAPGDGVYGLRLSLPPTGESFEPPPLLQVRAVDSVGRESNLWPALPAP
jgi:hypothetical protein